MIPLLYREFSQLCVAPKRIRIPLKASPFWIVALFEAV